MSDLLVRTRVAVAKRNLNRISELAAMIVRSEVTMNEFLDLPDDSRKRLATLLRELRTLMATAGDYETDDPVLWQGLEALATGLSAEVKTLTSKGGSAQTLRAGLVSTPATLPDIATYLVQGASELATVLSEETYWHKRERTEGLFNEYVDLLRGIALRNAGFGDEEFGIKELFAIADRLPSLWPMVEGWAWQSLAVPSRTERHGSTEAMVLRVGFPDWTIWALPIIQHEFGYVFLKKRGLLPTGTTGAEPAALADALATLVTGPAYACAVLLLRLDPALVTLEPAPATSTPRLGAIPGTVGAAVDQPSEVAVRSAAIVASLRSGAELDVPLQSLATRLESEWRDAVATTGGSVQAYDAALAAPATAQTVEAARKAVLRPGPNDTRLPPFWAEGWPIIAGWAARLKSNVPDVINLSELTSVFKEARPLDVAGLLNAAWLARVAPAAADDATDAERDRAEAATIRHLQPDTSSGSRSKVNR